MATIETRRSGGARESKSHDIGAFVDSTWYVARHLSALAIAFAARTRHDTTPSRENVSYLVDFVITSIPICSMSQLLSLYLTIVNGTL